MGGDSWQPPHFQIDLVRLIQLRPIWLEPKVFCFREKILFFDKLPALIHEGREYSPQMPKESPIDQICSGQKMGDCAYCSIFGGGQRLS
jgi:hypothetical protein